MEIAPEILLEAVGLELEPLETGPGDDIELIVKSGFNGESLAKFLFEFSEQAMSRVFVFLGAKAKGQANAEVSFEYNGKTTKLRIRGYSQEDATELIQEIQKVIRSTKASKGDRS